MAIESKAPIASKIKKVARREDEEINNGYVVTASDDGDTPDGDAHCQPM